MGQGCDVRGMSMETPGREIVRTQSWLARFRFRMRARSRLTGPLPSEKTFLSREARVAKERARDERR